MTKQDTQLTWFSLGNLNGSDAQRPLITLGRDKPHHQTIIKLQQLLLTRWSYVAVGS